MIVSGWRALRLLLVGGIDASEGQRPETAPPVLDIDAFPDRQRLVSTPGRRPDIERAALPHQGPGSESATAARLLGS